MKNIIIISGVSGAGKTSLLSIFEECGYYICDNIPFSLIKDFYNAVKKDVKNDKIALALNLSVAHEAYLLAKQDNDFNVSFIALDCDKDILLSRYRLTRRSHPLQVDGYTLEDAIDFEKQTISNIKINLTCYIDTSEMPISSLRKFVYNNLLSDHNKLHVNFVSFGYKKRVPQDLDLILDARLLNNPFWVDELKDLNGLNKKVSDYVLNNQKAETFLKKLTTFLDYYLGEIDISNKKIVNIGVACSGGQHRSVAVCEYLKKYYCQKYVTLTFHRELEK